MTGARLRQEGLRILLGKHLGRPVSSEEAAELLREMKTLEGALSTAVARDRRRRTSVDDGEANNSGKAFGGNSGLQGVAGVLQAIEASSEGPRVNWRLLLVALVVLLVVGWSYRLVQILRG